MAVFVAEHLDLDVPRTLDQLLDENGRVAECARGLARSRGKRGQKLGFTIHPPHAFTAAARDGFQHDGKARLARKRQGRRRILQPFGRTGDYRHTAAHGHFACFGLRAHAPDRLRGWTDERETRPLASRREFRVLAQKSVAGMNRVGARNPRGIKDSLNGKIALPRCRRSDANRFIRASDVQRRAIHLGEHRH